MAAAPAARAPYGTTETGVTRGGGRGMPPIAQGGCHWALLNLRSGCQCLPASVGHRHTGTAGIIMNAIMM